MSLNIIPLQVKRAIPAALNIRDGSNRSYLVVDGGSHIQYQQFQCGNPSSSTLPFSSVNPPDRNTVIDPQPMIRNKYRITLNVDPASGGGVGVNAYIPENKSSAPRSWPTHSALASIESKINGQSFTTDVRNYLHAFERMSNFPQKRDSDLSTFPSMPDMYQKYTDGRGSNNSPLGNYGDDPVECPRGSWPVTIVSNTNAQAVLDFETEEPVLCSPWYYNSHGLVNVTTLQFTFNFAAGNLLARIWSYEPPGTTSAITGVASPNKTLLSSNVQVLSSFMIFKYYFPKLLDRLPRNVIYSYNEVLNLNIDRLSSLAAGASDSLTISAVNLSAIPKLIAINVRDTDNTLNISSSDSFARIDSVSVNWNGYNPTAFSDYTPYELYKVSRSNGLSCSYMQFNNFVGSVFVFSPSKDIGVRELESGGSIGTPLFSAKVNFTNVSTLARTFSLYAHVLYEGTVTLLDGIVNKSISVLTPADVKRSLDADVETEIIGEPSNWYGGSFWSDLWSTVKSIASKVYTVGKEVAPYVKEGIDLAKRTGLLGMGEMDGGDLDEGNVPLTNMPAGGVRAGVRSGGVSSGGKKGGKMMSRAELKKQLIDMSE